MKINIIGAGKLGKTLGRLLVDNHVAEIAGIINSSRQSTLEAIHFIGQGQAFSDIDKLPHADLILISTPDDIIESCVQHLLHNPHIESGTMIIHCSGGLDSQILFPLKQKNCLIGSMHPLHSFADPILSIHQFAGTFCTLEGDEHALVPLIHMINAIGAQAIRIETMEKPRYHAGSVFASNYVIALTETAEQLFTESGIDSKHTKAMVSHLLRSVLTNIEQSENNATALTGPIQRGDYSTVSKHLTCLSPDLQALYRQLGLICLNMSSLELTIQHRLQALLNST